MAGTGHNAGMTNLARRAAAVIRWRHAAAGALAAAAAGEVAARAPGSARNPSLALVLALLGTLPLAAAPAHARIAAAAVVTGVLLAIIEPGRPTVAAAAAAVAALYLAARRGPARYALLVALPLLAAVALPAGKTPRLWAAVIFALAATAAALGTLRQARRRAAQADASVRALQATLAGHQARGERARIARELHDVAAHHILAHRPAKRSRGAHLARSQPAGGEAPGRHRQCGPHGAGRDAPHCRRAARRRRP